MAKAALVTPSSKPAVARASRMAGRSLNFRMGWPAGRCLAPRLSIYRITMLSPSRPGNLRTSTQSFEHGRLNVAAADHGHVHPGLRQAVFPEQEPGHRHRAAGLGHGLRVRRQPPQGFVDLVFADRDNIVDI